MQNLGFIGSAFVRRPDVVCVVFVWICTGILNIVPYKSAPIPLDISGLLLLALGVFGVTLGLVVSKPFTEEHRGIHGSLIQSKTRQKLLWLLPAIGLLGGYFQFTSVSTGGFDLGISEVRARYIEESYSGQLQMTKGIYGYLLFAPLLVFAIDFAIDVGVHWVQRFYLLCCICLFSVFAIFSVGGRSELNLFILFAFACFIVKKRTFIWENKAMCFGRLVFCIFAFMILNGVVFYLRGGTESSIQTYSYEQTIGAADTLFLEYGLAWLPNPVKYLGYWVYGYCGVTFSWFQFFVDRYDGDLSLGFLQLMSLYNRIGIHLGIPEPMTRKVQIDLMYSELGIEGNVWATGFREMIADFGMIGFPVVAFLVSWIFGSFRSQFQSSTGFRVAFLLWFCWCIYSPFSNLFRTRIFEIAFFYAIGLGLWERLFSKGLTVKKWVNYRKRVDLSLEETVIHH